MHVRSLIHKLYDLGAVKFGNFTLKSGISSPVYIDLRITVSSPKILVAIAEAMHYVIHDCKADLICGVPYTALPFATAISIQHTVPMVMRRKEKKGYGTGKIIEGIYEPGQKCLVVEDVITSGQSIFETIVPLNEAGLVVEDIVVLVDREQGGRKFIESKGYRVHPVCTISSIVDELVREKMIDKNMAASVKEFIRNNQIHG